MTAIKTLTAAAVAALTLAAGAAVAQTPYNQTPYNPAPSAAPQDRPQGERVLEGILGALFGTGQTSLDAEWSRGRRPLFNQRSAFEARLDAGVRDRTLSSGQAIRLRGDYGDLVALETRYAADGRFTTNERADLNARYRDLTQRLDDSEGGYDDGGYGDDRWYPLPPQADAFDLRVSAAQRGGNISRAEATRLRADFQALVRLEAQYDRDGLNAREREDLQTRYADLNRRIGDNYVPGDDGYGDDYGSDPRAARIEERIAAGVRNGSISRTEATRLRDELRDLSRRWADLEARVGARR